MSFRVINGDKDKHDRQMAQTQEIVEELAMMAQNASKNISAITRRYLQIWDEKDEDRFCTVLAMHYTTFSIHLSHHINSILLHNAPKA